MKTKTFIYALFFTCILIGFNGCDKEDEFMQVREIAWSSSPLEPTGKMRKLKKKLIKTKKFLQLHFQLRKILYSAL